MAFSARPWLLFGTLLLLSSGGCDDPREWRSRQRVRQLMKASPLMARAALQRVSDLGCYTLVDLEQAFHGAGQHARLRVLEAVEKMRCVEALPFLRFVARWDKADAVRKEAKRVAKALSP